MCPTFDATGGKFLGGSKQGLNYWLVALDWLLNHRRVVLHFAVADSVWGQVGDESA
jgi:hypothetical protein